MLSQTTFSSLQPTWDIKAGGSANSASRPNASCKPVDWDSGSMLTTVMERVRVLDIPAIRCNNFVTVSLGSEVET